MYCCQHRKGKGPCHHFPLYFIDGACANNGQKDAKAGVGIALGIREDDQLSIPVTDDVDSFPLRSNQRAELLAACLALSMIPNDPAFKGEPEFEKRHKRDFSKASDEPRNAIIATDSQYVVKGITEWLPTWKSKNWMTSKGTSPANLDLFLRVEEEVIRLEKENIPVGFWYIPRVHNAVADSLAKTAAAQGTVRTVEI